MTHSKIFKPVFLMLMSACLCIYHLSRSSRYVPEEEREAKFLRMVTSSLLGVKRLLSSLPQADRQGLEDRLAHLITQAKFWKYSKHKYSQVREKYTYFYRRIESFYSPYLNSEIGDGEKKFKCSLTVSN